MLVLPIQTRGALIVLRDAGNGRASVALARPRLAGDAAGGPRLHLTRWAVSDGAAGAVPAVGGRLVLDVEIAPTEAEIAAAGLDPERVRPLPWLDASVRLEAPGLEPVVRQVSIAAGAVGVLSVDLTDHQAAVLAPLLTADVVSPLQLTWEGRVKIRLPAVEVIATAVVDEIRRRVESVQGVSRRVVTRSIIEASARIEIRGADDPEIERSLRQWVLDELAARFASGDDLMVRAAAADVVHWPLHLATTADVFLPAEARQGLVTRIILTPDETGATPPVEVRALGDFAGPLERVDVRLRPRGGGEIVKLALTDDQTRQVPLGTDRFQWRHRVKLASGPPSGWSPWQTVDGSFGLLVPVSTPSDLAIEVLAAGLDLTDRWRSVRIRLEHHAPGSSPLSAVVELDAAQRSRTWSAALTGPRGEVSAQLTYLSRRGLTVERTVEGVTGDQLVVKDPFDAARLRVALVPTGTGWGDVATTMVDLRYRDGPETYEEAVALGALNDFAEWEAPSRPGAPRDFAWRYHASFQDGRFEQSAWQSASGPVLTVPIAGQPQREVQLLPIYFDADRASRLEVRLRSNGHSETVEVTNTTPRTVTMPPGPYRCGMTWWRVDGTMVEVEEKELDEDVLVLPRPP